MKDTIVSGIQPTGELHVGNYLGAIRHWLSLQEKENCFFFVADYHAQTQEYDPEARRKETLSIMADLLALGLNPKKATLFLQSDVPEVTELAWILSTVTPVAFLERMVEYKEKLAQGKSANLGLFSYPVLMAADILLYGGTKVPVGLDQRQHIELARDTVNFFNNRFGATFIAPEALLTPTPKIMSLLDPNKKMSKSLGPNHYLAISDSPQMIKEKVRRAVTDTGPKGEAAGAGVANLFLLLKNFGEPQVFKRFSESFDDGSIKYVELKDAVAGAMADYFADYRQKKAKLLAAPAKVKAVFAAGAKKARGSAKETLKKVRKKIGLR